MKFMWKVLPVLLVLALSLACSKLPASTSEDGSPAGSNAFASSNAAATSVSVPAGTAISIRLQSSVSSATAHAGDTFEAVVDEPVVVGGQTVVAAALKLGVVCLRRARQDVCITPPTCG